MFKNSNLILNNFKYKLHNLKICRFSGNKDIKFAVLLSGNGVYDGSEITESVSCLIALSKHNVKYQCFSINKDQFDVVNHTNGEKLNQDRNVLIEAARIARGDIKDIKELKSVDFDGLVIPGGFGIAKNFSTFATENEKYTVDKEVERVIKEFHENKKKICACCIAPILLGKVLGTSTGGPGVKLTLGLEGKDWPYASSIKVVENLGNIVERCDIDKISIDEKNKLITTPAYMKGDANPYHIFAGIERMISEAVKRIRH